MEFGRMSIEFTDRNITSGASDYLTGKPVANLVKSCYRNSTMDALVLVKERQFLLSAGLNRGTFFPVPRLD